MSDDAKRRARNRFAELKQERIAKDGIATPGWADASAAAVVAARSAGLDDQEIIDFESFEQIMFVKPI